MSNILAVPLKKLGSLDLGARLHDIIEQEYFHSPSQFVADLAKSTAINARVADMTDTNVTPASIEACQQYLALLALLRSKFPDDLVEFGWQPTIGHGLSALVADRRFLTEVMNVVFQLGAVYCQLAVKESRHTDDGLKQLCNYFQLAAGTWQYLEGQTESNPEAAPREFDKETLLCLQNLMLAQAQELIWQKALSNNLKDTVVAKLSLGLSEIYNQAYQAGSKSPQIILEWLNHMRVKHYHFAAAAHYRMASIELENQHYGEQVGHLRAALSRCVQALRHKRYVNSFVLEDLAGLEVAINESLLMAEKENDLIYLQVVPLELDLKPIAASTMVAPLIPAMLVSPPTGINAFEDLLPYIILQVAQAFRERQDEYVQSMIISPLNSLSGDQVRFLADLDLPLALDAIQQPENLTDSLIQHAKSISAKGGAAALESKIDEVVTFAMKLQKLVQECQFRIDLDNSEDQMLRGYFGSQVRPPTAVAAKDIIDKLGKLRDYLKQAQAGDERVRETYISIKLDIQTYSGSLESLAKVIPNSKYIALDTKITNCISHLRDLLAKLDKMVSDRDAIIDGVEIRSRGNSILGKVIEKYRQDKLAAYNENGSFNERMFEPVYEEQIRMFSSESYSVQEQRTLQQQLQQEITASFQDFKQQWKNRTSESQAHRQQVLQHFESVYVTYCELMNHLDEGAMFYKDFLTKGTAVVQECENFLVDRRNEARKMEERKQRGLSPGSWA